MGFPWLSKRHQKDADLGNVLIHFMIEVLQALESHPRAEDGSLVLVFGEHPEDLGTIWREEDRMQMHPASIWQLPQLRDFVRADNPLQLFTVVFNQCCWSAPYRKPTRLITNLMSLKTWGPNTWPVFGHDGAYKGLLRTFAAALLQFHWLAPLLMTPFALPQLPSTQSLWTEPLLRPFCFLSTPLPPKLKRGQ